MSAVSPARSGKRSWRRSNTSSEAICSARVRMSRRSDGRLVAIISTLLCMVPKVGSPGRRSDAAEMDSGRTKGWRSWRGCCLLPGVPGCLGVSGGLSEASGQVATFGVGGGQFDGLLVRLGCLGVSAESTEQIGAGRRQQPIALQRALGLQLIHEDEA